MCVCVCVCVCDLYVRITLMLISRLAVQAEMKEVLQEQKESNDRLKSHTNEFHDLLKKNSPA